MISSMFLSLACGLVVAMAAGMAAILIARGKRGASHRSLAALLAAIALANLADGIGLYDKAHVLFWRETALIAELLQPAAILYIGLTFLNPAESGKAVSALWQARITGIVGGLLAMAAVAGLVFRWMVFEDGRTVIALTSWGHAHYIFIIIGMAVALAQLEHILRASREPMRHRLKFIVIGLGGLAGHQIYQASQILLVPVWESDYLLVSWIVTIVALALIAYGVVRGRLREIFVDTYVSQQTLFGSVTFIVIGLYLLAVGAVGEWLRLTDQPLGSGLSVIVVFGALVGLAIVAFSKTVRARLRYFVSRNFYRSKYDYRAQWLQVTKVFEQAGSKETIMDRLLDLLIKTFPTTSISIWWYREAERRYCQIRSMTTEKEPLPLELSHPVIMQLMNRDEPVWIEENLKGKNEAAVSAGDPLADSGVALCFPICAKGQLTAFIALGKSLHGESYGVDDCDLLRGISHHVGAILSHARLAEEREALAELEALHRFSVFCLHDLKNLAARLSLVAQNAERHGRDPVFQESAMGTVTDTVNKMTSLISKLSLKSPKPAASGVPELVDILELIKEITDPLKVNGAMRVHLTAGEDIHPVMAVRDQIHQLLLNVILNAKQAIGEKGEVSVAVDQLDGSVVITVRDTGCGIPSTMLDSLFHPSQSSRPGGLGVGLYQCKQIVEAHRGTIQIRSEVGKGTQVKIELPLSPVADHETVHVNR
jgi:putative PEP-CTERM system histidine kinase